MSSLRIVEDLMHERGIDICHETVRQWWMRFGTLFAAEIRRKRAKRSGAPHEMVTDKLDPTAPR